MTDIIVLLILISILTSSAMYIYKAKKKGKTCIGCPHANECKKNKCM